MALVRRLVRSAASGPRRFWLALGAALLLLVALDVAARAILLLFFMPRDVPRSLRADLSDLQRQQIAYYQELNEKLRLDWRPYVHWRTRALEGQYINVDDAGHRRTWQPESRDADGSSESSRIFMFGGSSMWGLGARDDQTIPSLVARQLVEQDRLDVAVENHAVPGFVLSQEAIALARELARGNVPEVVVFCDGANDVLSAFVHHRAGWHVLAFEELNGPTYRIWNRSGLVRLSRRLQHRTSWGAHMHDGPRLDTLEALAAEVIDHYEQQVAFVEKLAAAYGFPALFYWQPVVFHKDELDGVETRAQQVDGIVHVNGIDFYAQGTSFGDLFRASAEQLAASKLADNPNFHDLSEMFRDEPTQIFIDFCHTTEEANAEVAQRMAGDIREALSEGGG